MGKPQDWATSAWAANPKLVSGAAIHILVVDISNTPTLALRKQGAPGFRSCTRIKLISPSAMAWTTAPARVTGLVAPGWAVGPGIWGMPKSAATNIRSTTSAGNTRGEIGSGYSSKKGRSLSLSNPPTTSAAISKTSSTPRGEYPMKMIGLVVLVTTASNSCTSATRG